MDFTSKIVVITGGGGGWGQTVVEAFLQANAAVVVIERPKVAEAMETWKRALGERGGRVSCLAGDVLNEASVERMMQQVLDQHGRLDVLVNIVGGFTMGQPVSDLPLETWEHMMNLNLRSTFLCSKFASRPMMQQRWGRIINISSRSAVQPSPKAAAYAVSKAGVIALTETQAAELKDYAVTVNAVVPSIVDTPANRQAMPNADFSRWPRGEEIASVILFLASEEAKLISGAAIPVYGQA